MILNLFLLNLGLVGISCIIMGGMFIKLLRNQFFPIIDNNICDFHGLIIMLSCMKLVLALLYLPISSFSPFQFNLLIELQNLIHRCSTPITHIVEKSKLNYSILNSSSIVKNWFKLGSLLIYIYIWRTKFEYIYIFVR